MGTLLVVGDIDHKIKGSTRHAKFPLPLPCCNLGGNPVRPAISAQFEFALIGNTFSLCLASRTVVGEAPRQFGEVTEMFEQKFETS